MKKVLFLTLVLILCLFLGACGEKQEAGQDILGQWVCIKDDTYTITFLEDGTCFYTGTAPVDPTPNTVTLSWGNSPYKYTYNAETEIITIYSAISHNYEVVTENGNIALATISGPVSFVRSQNYGEYHSAYLAEEEAKKQAEIAAFYEEGRNGRTELEFGTAYTIQDGLNMTATDYVIAKNEYFGFSGEYFLYLKVTVENVSSKGIYIRQDGVKEGSMTLLAWGSDVRANVEAKQLGSTSHGDFIVITGNASTNASDYFFRYDELGKPRLINSGNHIYLKSGQQEEYYLYIPNIDIESAKKSPAYATLTFDNYDFFCEITGLEKEADVVGTPDSTPNPTPAPTPKSTTAPTPKPTIPPECGHSYKDATCTVPQTCSYCGATNGNALGHDFKDATCENPKTCTKCGKVEGDYSNHIDVNGTCTFCGKTRQGTENTERVLNYLKANAGKNVTAEDVAAALGMEKRSVDGIFTSAIQRKGLGVRTPAEIQLEDGTYKQVKYLSLTPAGMVYQLWS